MHRLNVITPPEWECVVGALHCGFALDSGSFGPRLRFGLGLA